MPDNDVSELLRRWAMDPGHVTDEELDILQAAHDAAGHFRTHPVNGSCFCCCEACLPDVDD